VVLLLPSQQQVTLARLILAAVVQVEVNKIHHLIQQTAVTADQELLL
jgi:hypothetical protein